MSLPVHLVGSINLADKESVFADVARNLGEAVARIPDGETGERLTWTAWLIPLLRQHPALEEREPAIVSGFEYPQFGIRAEAASDEFVLDTFEYASVALDSWSSFSRLKQAGVIPAETRFQVSLPTPAALLISFIDPADRLLLEQPIERGLIGAVEEIATTIPPDELAVQWDAPAEVGVVEGVFPSYYADEEASSGAVRRLARLGRAMPDGLQLGYHLCYGDTGDIDDPEGSHWKNPEDLSVVVSLANAIGRETGHLPDYYHFPVPIARDDSAYFSPLSDLALPEQCTVFLGLLHREDGLDGARRRADSARPYLPRFGVATECGMGRERREEVEGLLGLHASASSALDDAVSST